MKLLQKCHDGRTLTQVKRTSWDGCVRPAAQAWTANAASVTSLSRLCFEHTRPYAGLPTESPTFTASSGPLLPQDAASQAVVSLDAVTWNRSLQARYVTNPEFVEKGPVDAEALVSGAARWHCLGLHRTSTHRPAVLLPIAGLTSPAAGAWLDNLTA